MNGFNSSVNGDNSINRMIDSNGSKIDGPEVFLGGSCNPTTWRADVAIPALSELGISFYNPVSIFLHYSRQYSYRKFKCSNSKFLNGRPT